MIIGAHVIVQSTQPEADRAFFRDVLALPFVDEGGWPIYGLPPSEVAVHPADKDGVYDLYLMCADVKAFIKAMKAKKIACGSVSDQGWGILTSVTLPGGGKLGVYQPRHARPEAPGAKKNAPAKAAPRKPVPVPARAKKQGAKKPAKKAPAKRR